MKTAIMRFYCRRRLFDEVRVEYLSDRFYELAASDYKLVAVEVAR